jgi:hypothetical protein
MYSTAGQVEVAYVTGVLLKRSYGIANTGGLRNYKSYGRAYWCFLVSQLLKPFPWFAVLNLGLQICSSVKGKQ